MSLNDSRKEYSMGTLTSESVDPNPFKQFAVWFEEAKASDLIEANAMVLATADVSGKPSARVVLLKKFDDDGFVFFTNYESKKAEDLRENPNASLLFYWDKLERQVRISGAVSKTTAEENALYFQSRPRGSQIAASISPQSKTVENRKVLENLWEEKYQQLADKKIPTPEYWGGYRLHPEQFEFWQGRENRLHDRIKYSKLAANSWQRSRVAP